MHANKTIVLAAVLLTATGAYQVLYSRLTGKNTGPTLTRVVVGGYMLAVIASVVDLISPSAGYVAGLLMMLALTTVALTIAGNLGSLFAKKQRGA